MITDELVEKALEYIRTSAPEHAQAKADRIHIENFRKSKKGELIGDSPESTMVGKEAWAYAHPEYQELIAGLQVAVAQEDELFWKMKAALATTEVYRTQQANNRLTDKAHT